MKIRVIHCEDESHDMAWIKAEDCSHWSMECPRAKKAKKSHHKLKKRSKRGYGVLVNGVMEDPFTHYDSDGWLYSYDPPEYALELTEKWYEGHWCPGPEFRFHRRCGVRPGMMRVDGAGLGGVFVTAPEGLLIECVTGCGLVGAE